MKKTEQSKEWIENPDYQELTKSADRARLIPRTEVVLLDEDLGLSVERIFGSDEYEYSLKIPASRLLHFSSCSARGK